ncbi:MAG: hypothetical protein AAFQ21_08870, partial [Pseudomonadota bacterium]
SSKEAAGGFCTDGFGSAGFSAFGGGAAASCTGLGAAAGFGAGPDVRLPNPMAVYSTLLLAEQLLNQ